MKRRSVIMIIMTFMLLTLVGVGFATWIITAPTTDGEATGNIKVETVQSQKAWQFDAKWVKSPTDLTETTAEIVFGTKSSDSIKQAWLTNEKIKDENLTAYLYVIANVDKNIGVNVADNDIANVDLKAVVTKTSVPAEGETSTTTEEVVDLEGYLEGVATVSITVDGNVITKLTAKQLREGVVLTITFGWDYKDKEGNPVSENPYTYFNGKKYDDYYAIAEKYLTDLYSKLNVCDFKVVLTAAVEATE